MERQKTGKRMADDETKGTSLKGRVEPLENLRARYQVHGQHHLHDGDYCSCCIECHQAAIFRERVGFLEPKGVSSSRRTAEISTEAG